MFEAIVPRQDNFHLAKVGKRDYDKISISLKTEHNSMI